LPNLRLLLSHQLEASRKQHEVLWKRLKAKKVILHTNLLCVGGSTYTSHTLNHLKSSALMYKKPIRHCPQVTCSFCALCT